MSPVIRCQIVLARSIFLDSVDVVLGCQVQIDVLNVVGSRGRDRGGTFRLEVLRDVGSTGRKVATRQRGKKNWRCAG